MSVAKEEARRLRELAARLERQADKLDKLEPVALMLSELGDGSVVTFEKQFRGADRVYSYAAIKTNGRWYLTSSREKAKTDAEFAAFLGSQYDEGRVWSPDTLEVLRSTPAGESFCPTCGSSEKRATTTWYKKALGMPCPDDFHEGRAAETTKW